MKKGQIQIQETILVLFIVVVIILLGLIVFYKYSVASITQENQNYFEDKFNQKIITLPELTEIKCSFYTDLRNCIDTTKLISFSIMTKREKTYYSNLLGNTNITIIQVYPNKKSNECTTNKATNCGVWNIYSKVPTKYTDKLIVESPISLYNPLEDKYTIGKLIIEGYQ